MESYKQARYLCSIDVGLVRLGYCVLGYDRVIQEIETVNLNPPKDQKLIDRQCQIISNIQEFIGKIIAKYSIDLFVIEQQIGKFCSKQIEMCIIQAIMNAGSFKIDTLSPKCKLSMKFIEFEPKKETTKYNQNKNQSVANAKSFLERTGQPQFTLDRDKSDALLQGLYYISKRVV